MADKDASEADHPRLTADLRGHEHAEQRLIQMWRGGRLPHGILMTGPRGIGKATLGYRLARAVLAHGEGAAESLTMAPEDSVFRQVAQRAHPDLLVLERTYDEKAKRLRSEIVVDEVRRLRPFFGATASGDGWRVAIVDAADEMNLSAANALLKQLEEPPTRGLLILIAHAPGRLLPTIRSRCQVLPLRALAADDLAAILAAKLGDYSDEERMALSVLSEGSAGQALALAGVGGLDLYRELVTLLAPLPELDVAGVQALGDRVGRRGQEAVYATLVRLLLDWLTRMVRAGAEGRKPVQILSDERSVIERLWQSGKPERWLDAWEHIRDLTERADALNLDKKQIVINVFTTLSVAAGAAR